MGMELHFGFSYMGALFLVLLIAPNLLWTKNKPKGYEEQVKGESRLLLFFERLGEVLVSCTVLIFSGFNFQGWSAWAGFLLAALLLMLLYELYWLRYFKSDRELKDFYSSLLGIPVAGATLPVLAFLLLGIYGRNPFLILATLLLGVGHIGIHLEHRKKLPQAVGPK